MKYLEDSRLTQLTSDLTEAFLNTRGTDPGVSGSLGKNGGFRNKNKGSNRGTKNKNQNQQKPKPMQKGGSKSKSAYLPSSTYAYNPARYTSYGGSTGGVNEGHASSSCRAIYGKVEAYTTKRAGSDKKTAHEVGEKYAHEMERMNEAVEEMKRKHSLEIVQGKGDSEKQMSHNDVHDRGEVGGQKTLKQNGPERGESFEGEKDVPRVDDGIEGVSGTDIVDVGNGAMCDSPGKKQRVSRRARSCSVDGVTFAKSPTKELRIVSNDVDPVVPIDNSMKEIDEGSLSPNLGMAKRNLPLEGILKPPSSNKRWRATSFDVSTGPSTFNSRHTPSVGRGSDYPSLFDRTAWGNSIGANGDQVSHPLIPQPSLYQSSLADSHHHPFQAVPRRLVTDLILTLNASFPDYDFGDARPSDFCTLPVSEAIRRINENLGEFASSTDKGQDFLPRFWSALDDVIFGLKDAEVYSYAPSGGGSDDDPLGFLTMTLAGGNDRHVDDGDTFTPILTPMLNRDSICGTGSQMDGFDSSMSLDLPHRILPSPAIKSDDPALVTLWTMNYFFVSGNKKRIVLFACVQTMRSPQGNEDEENDREEYEYGENDLVFDEARRGLKQEKEGNFGYSSIGDFLSETRDESVTVDGDCALRGAATEDTDFDEVDVDVDGDEDHDENDLEIDDVSGLATSVLPPTSPQERFAMT